MLKEGGIMQEVQFYRDATVPFFELKLCDSGRLAYKKHAHEEYSLGIIQQGKSSFWCEGGTVEICPQTVVLIPPGVVHSCNPERAAQWQYKMLFIEAGWVKSFLASIGAPDCDQPLVRTMSRFKAAAMSRLVDTLASLLHPMAKEAQVMTLLEQMVTDSIRTAQLTVAKHLPKRKIIMEYLQDNFLHKVTLAELEQISGISRFNIVRSFKEEFSIPPHTYQTLLRINYAKKQLRQNRHILDVAYEAGFYDQSHFNKVFKSHTGATPEKYQKLK